MKHQINKQFRTQVLICNLVIVLIIFARPGITGTSVGNPGKALTLSNLATQADFVFQGTVQEIQYALSKPTGSDKVELPYTFVTYKISRVIKGFFDKPTVTLRFVGGLRSSDGTILRVSHIPTFDIAEEDILFVGLVGT